METVKLLTTTKSYIWGGDRLFKFGKKSSEDIIAESWELSFYPGSESIINSGKDLGKKISEVASKTDLGTSAIKFPFFPVLIKMIDAKNDLSIQVHPSDEYALKNENSFGKTEMWYVLDAEKGAQLHIGFSKDVSDKEVRERIENNTLTEVMNHIDVKPGDCYFIPSGTLHAIGKGCLIVEIQENSNLTYRVYDYGRVGADGKPRELHVEKALKVLDFNKLNPINIQGETLADCPYFNVKRMCNVEKLEADNNSFMSFTVLKGKGKVNDIDYDAGDTFFIPAGKQASITGNPEIIITKVN